MSTWAKYGDNGQLTSEKKQQLVRQVVKTIQEDDYPLAKLRDRKWLREKSIEVARHVASRSSSSVNLTAITSISEAAVAMVGGLGFMHELLPPVRNDLSEISLDADGRLWVMPRDDVYFKPLDYRPSQDEVWRAVDALLAHSGQAISRAMPSVDGKLPRSAGMGGARIKVIHPSIAPGLGFPLFNVRLFEPKPVHVAQLLTWDVAPPKVFALLQGLVGQGKRILITGGTYTGKTTILSALANFIPPEERIVKIEDPEEIWIDHPHVISLEARPAPPGSDVPGYSMADGVNDAMRLSPRWLIVGEVRKGDVALDLFSDQMSDHPGISTFHAESPAQAVHRLSIMLFRAKAVQFMAAKESFLAAIDNVVQLGWVKRKRKMLGVWAVHKKLRGGNVAFEDIWLTDDFHKRVQTDNVQDSKDLMVEIERGEKTYDFSR